MGRLSLMMSYPAEMDNRRLDTLGVIRGCTPGRGKILLKKIEEGANPL